jgi:hypothetical protein
VHKFLRDLAVNVLANLIAAYIVYLIGVAVGAFPRYRVLLSLIMAIATGGGGNFIYSVLLIKNVQQSRAGDEQRLRALGLGAIGLGVVTLLATFAAGDMLPLWERLVHAASGVAIVFLGGSVTLRRVWIRKEKA